MVHAFPSALVAGTIHDDGRIAGNPSEDWYFLKLLLGQRTNLRRHRQANSWDIKVGGMVTDIDIRFPGMNIFPAVDFIGNEIEFTEGP